MTTGFEGLAYPQFVPSPGKYSQRVNELLDYGIDWSTELPTGDTIVASTWVGDTGLTLSNESFTTTTTTVWVSGGTKNYLYRVLNTITTAGGRVAVGKLYFRIK